ncbi:threonine/serine exporter family protein [Paucilactobacillus kaifaensis]|uniref:threonine/serine exporter family protein n=1 Tax=Paucilactobacillus kaifaensis TaxID=2559921 RepID=UPI0010F5315D|nr:threonine/serine exporter family protein [Paucilactobacillus kaifaensis]
MAMFLFELVMAYVATICFGIILNIPTKAFNVAGLIGAFSWGFYWVISQLGVGIAFGNLAAAFVISVLSMYAAQYKKMPMVIFNIPSLVSFVPGGQAYQMIRNFAIGQSQTAWSFFVQVVVIAGSIAMGFILGELYHQIWRYGLTKIVTRH